MSFGSVDTLNLLFDKLQGLLNDSQGYYESFLDANTLYKQGKLSEKEFFKKLGDYVVAYSALEFLAVKVIFELKKAVDKISSGTVPVTTTGSGMSAVGGFGMTHQNPMIAPNASMAGRPPPIISAAAFNIPGALPTPDQSLLPQSSKTTDQRCSSCGASVRSNAKFCTKCGNKI